MKKLFAGFQFAGREGDFVAADLPVFGLRTASRDDEGFLADLYRECHRQEFAPLGLTEDQLDGLMQMQARGQREGYARDYPRAENQIVVDSETGGPVGRILVDSSVNGLHLIDIALMPEWRGRGIGTALIEGLMQQACASQIPIRLHVRQENRAANLYQRLGFSEVSRGAQIEMQFLPEEPKRPAVRESEKLHPLAEKWNARVGRSFVLGNVRWEKGPSILRLASVDTTHGFGSGCFSLMFHGPLTPILQQSMYLLRPETLVSDEEPFTPEDEIVFLVPVGPEGEKMRYEAVFNL